MKIIIWGGTGQCLVVTDALFGKDFHVSAIFDNAKNINSPLDGIPLYDGSEFESWYSLNPELAEGFVCAIGGGNGKARVSISNMLEEKGLKPVNVINHSAYLASNSEISKGVQILANATICAKAKIGNYVIINNSANIDHECIIGDGAHIGPGVSMAGCVEVGEYSFIGTGATILPRIKIGCNSIVGAGAVVTRDIPDNTIAYGVPARNMGNRK